MSTPKTLASADPEISALLKEVFLSGALAKLQESIDQVVALIEKARAEEREACAKIAEEHDYHGARIAQTIRMRGDK